MELYRLSATITVSSQLVVKDLEELKKNGVDILVCNRPDNESPEQPRFENIATAAKHMGITPINISFKPDNQTEQDVIAFEKILNSNKKVHAFCRTGNRSITLWAAASVRTGSCPNQILKKYRPLDRPKGLLRATLARLERPSRCLGLPL